MTWDTDWKTWREAMTIALYGKGGFYHQPAGPVAHFRTSVHASPLFAESLLRVARSVCAGLGDPPGFTVVDLGAGRGELLSQIVHGAPAHWRLVAVDVVERPSGLPDRVEWRQGLDRLEHVPHGLLVANEWLDVIPLDVVEDGRLVEVTVDGAERRGGVAGGKDQQWLSSWSQAHGGRVEVGWPRDEAWTEATSRLGLGLALAIDYRADPENDGGTLTGFRNGRQVPPVPDGHGDLTAHVLLESCAEAAGGEWLLLDQRSALYGLQVAYGRPDRTLAGLDPAAYLRALAAASEAAELTRLGGFGGFGWLLQARDAPLSALVPHLMPVDEEEGEDEDGEDDDLAFIRGAPWLGRDPDDEDEEDEEGDAEDEHGPSAGGAVQSH